MSKTNFQRIKEMSVEEMAEFLNLYCGEICQSVSNCGNCGFDECRSKHKYGICGKTLEWLESEVE